METTQILIPFFSALAAGFVNAIAGGGTLITFPALILYGLSPVQANITNTVALCPGYIGGTFAQRKDLFVSKEYILPFIVAGVAGGLTGAVLLFLSGEKIFSRLVPYLLLLASALLIFQDFVKKIILNKNRKIVKTKNIIIATTAIFSAAIYGGYFGAGLGVILLAVLGLLLEKTIAQLNALKQLLSFTANITAALWFSVFGNIDWFTVLLMAGASLAGGFAGGKTAQYISPVILRFAVAITGVVIACIFIFQ